MHTIGAKVGKTQIIKETIFFPILKHCGI